MKKKQFKRLEKLLVDTVDAHVHSNTLLHSMMSDQRAIAETHAEGGAAILEAVRDVEVRIGIATERAGDYLDSIDAQMAPLSHASEQWSQSQVRSGPGLDEFTAGGTDIPEPKAPEGPDPTTADSWAGKMGDDLVGPNPNLQREAVERMEGKLLTNAEDVARQGDPNPPKPGETVARLQSDVAKWRERASTAINEFGNKNEKIRLIMHELTGNDRSNLTLPWAVRDCIMELVDTNDELQKKLVQEGEASSIYRSKMLENERQLKLAVGEAQALPVDASMDAFIKWVGNHGWKWILGHRATINERLDRMEREAAYNRGNATVQDVTTTEDRGVTTSTLGKPRVIKDNPQA